jgi:SPX domain protein involved in polyphosphate accumulation
MNPYIDKSRYEFKYWLTLEKIPEVRDYVKTYADLDPFLRSHRRKKYTVRSIYFDTPELDSYYERMDGVKIRKKLRVRAYSTMDDFAFLEIKRKYVNAVIKERSKMPFVLIEKLVNTPEHTVFEFESQDHNGRLVSGKFMYNLLKKGLVPSLLIAYEREAYVGQEDQNNRLTIDTHIRSQFQPDFEDMFYEKNFIPVVTDKGILELKFDNFMPKWMRSCIQTFRLQKRRISKYCLSIDKNRKTNREDL